MSSLKLSSRGWLAVPVIVAMVGLTACSGGSQTADAGSGEGDIEIWAHQGADAENAVIQAAVDAFNASQSEITAKLTLIPETTYTSTVQNTPLDDLPDVLETDGPTLASFVYDGKLAPLEQFVSAETVDNATPGSINEGTYDGTLYGLAMFDSALGLWGNKALLDEAGVTYPKSIDEAWTADEFSSALAALAAANPSGYSLDIYEGALASEWGTYGFSPLIQSAGGNLIDGTSASGAIDSQASIDALEDFVSWKPFVDPNADFQAFPAGRTALAWGMHWMYPSYSEALGDDLLVLPLPNMGQGTKTGAGSWTWGVGASTENGKAAGTFIDFLLSDENVTAMTDANGAPPATQSVFDANTLYASDGPLALWGQQIQASCAADDITPDCVAVLRPATPGYPTITAEFQKALSAAWNGDDAKASLTKAAAAIDQNFSDNSNYQ